MNYLFYRTLNRAIERSNMTLIQIRTLLISTQLPLILKVVEKKRQILINELLLRNIFRKSWHYRDAWEKPVSELKCWDLKEYTLFSYETCKKEKCEMYSQTIFSKPCVMIYIKIRVLSHPGAPPRHNQRHRPRRGLRKYFSIRHYMLYQKHENFKTFT